MSAFGPVTDLLSTLPAAGAAGFLAGLAVKATVVLAAGALLSTLLARASAAARHLVWVLTFVALAALPVAAGLLPVLDLAWLPAAAPAADSSARAARADLAAAADPAATSGDQSVAVPAAAPGTAAAPSLAARLRAATGSFARSDAGLGAAVYVLGAVLLLAWLAAGLALVRRLTRGGRSADGDPAWAPLLASLRDRLALRRPVSLVVSESVRVPMTWGARPPVVLLPDAAEGWSDAHRRDALLHELAHVARRDWPLQLLARAVCAVYWFHPLAWYALSRLRLEAERAADDRVLAAGSPSCDYAQRLLDLARASSRLRPQAAVAMAGRNQLAQRIRALLDSGRRRTPPGRAAAVAVAAAVLLPALALAPVRLTAAPWNGEDGGLDLDVSIEAGADVDLGGVWNRDAAMEADADAESGGESGGDSNATWRRSDAEAQQRLTPLMRAAARGDRAEVDRLLAAGADPDAGVASLGTPLILAADAGHRAVVERLLAAGADPNEHETGNRRPGDLPRSPLGAAARSGDAGTLRLLLDAGAAVNGTPRGDATPLMIAAGHAHLEAVELLLSRGADANAVVKGDGTPLIEAARGGSLAIVDRLLAAGADAAVGVAADGNPLIWAADAGNREMVEVLLAAGADPDAWVSGDENAFFHAVTSGDAETVRRLLAAGADPNQTWSGDGSPLIVASASGNREIVDLLLAAGARADAGVNGDGNALIQAAANGDVDTLDALLATGADPDAAVPGDGNPLIAAAGSGHLEAVRHLLDAGADVDRVVPGDENPLIQAAGGGHLDVVRYLVDEGANVNARVVVRNGWGRSEVRTPLAMARRGGHDEVVRYLQSRGAVE